MAGSGDNDKQALIGVTKVNDSDIICGRGGLALKHPGNMAYRKIVGLNKELYATCLKTEKLRISKSIVAAIREINGRFLEREDGKTSSSLTEKDENGNPVKWRDIGDKRAIEKTSQALREGQPKLLKKLAQRQVNGHGAVAVGAGGVVNPMANFNHMGNATQSQMMPQFSHTQTLQQHNNFVQDQTFGLQPPVQNTLQGHQRPTTLQDQREPSFTLSDVTEGQTFSPFPRNSFNENNNSGNSGPWNRSELFHDSWGDQDLAPLPGKRSNSAASNDSWGGEDPMPLPYNEIEENNDKDENVFSKDDHQHLMSALGVGLGDGLQDGSPQNSAKEVIAKTSQRPSVKFQIPQATTMSITSHMSEMSIFSDARSLDSAMDAAEREAEFELLGEFDGEMTINTFESPSSGSSGLKPRRSILRKNNKWTTPNALPTAPANHADPGLIFTSTLDTNPGGINSGTDISDMMGERRKSAVAFEVDFDRRRSSRMSVMSVLTDFSGNFRRDVGSILSIQSADFRELMADLEDSDEGSAQGKTP